jgi:hypothetical protein
MRAAPVARYVLLAAIGLLIGYFAGCWSQNRTEAAPISRTLAMSWGDGTNGRKAFYGAHVYVIPSGTGYSVRLTVYIGRPDNLMYYAGEYGEIGKATSWEDAVARFSTIRWTKEALRVGTGAATDYSVARSSIENHR